MCQALVNHCTIVIPFGHVLNMPSEQIWTTVQHVLERDRRGHSIANFKNKNRRRLKAILPFFFGDFWITACIIYIGRGICFVDELFRWMFYWFLKVSLPVRRIALWMEQIEIDPVYSHILKCISNTKNKSSETRKTFKLTRKMRFSELVKSLYRRLTLG